MTEQDTHPVDDEEQDAKLPEPEGEQADEEPKNDAVEGEEDS